MQFSNSFRQVLRAEAAQTVLVCLAIWLTSGTPNAAANSLGKASQASLGQDRPIREAHLLSPAHGWVLAGDRLLWTGNNGGQWNDVTPPLGSNRSIDGAFFLDANHAWAIIHQRDEYPEHIYIAVTTNGGNAWSVESLTTDKDVLEGYANLAKLSFPDASHGWILLTKTSSSAGSLSYLYATSNGGESWSRLPDPPVNGSFAFFTTRMGWLCGGVQGDELYVTRNSGQTWTQQVLPEPPQVQKAVHKGCFLPSFADSKKGMDVLSYDVTETAQRTSPLLEGTATYVTSDGGETWQVRSTEQPTKLGPGAMSIFDSTIVTAYYAGNAIVIAANTRKQVARLPAGLDAPHLVIREMSFVDSQDGWLVGIDDCLRQGCTSVTALFGTEDGGKTLSLLLQNSHLVQAATSAGQLTPTTATPGPGAIQPSRTIPE
ncbi:MAG TPA: hypothetical protein VMF91_26935 [Bryobacteraceae bacterium]|nr:hypothetical protein [Bryobacteraceae bacterium]